MARQQAVGRTIGVPRWHFPRIPRKWMELGILSAIFAIIAGVVLWKNLTPSPTPIPIPEAAAPGPSVPALAAPVAPTSTPTPTPPPEMILAPTIMGDIIVRLEGVKHVSYGLGYWFTPPGNPDYPRYDFPLAVSKTKDGRWERLAEIADPNIGIGEEWTLIVRDPDHENFVLRIKLIRVDAVYKYKSWFFFSRTNGESWYSPADYPVELPPGS